MNEYNSWTHRACSKRVSSLHTALFLQDTIADAVENNEKLIVTYLDVSKAFDGVKREGLFFKLRNLDIKGKSLRS